MSEKSDDQHPEKSTQRHHSEREHSRMARLLTLFMIFSSMSVVTAKLISEHPLRSANDRSRWCTVWSLVERGTYEIDEIRQRPGWDTIDLVRHNDHFYSTKPPLLPWLAAGLYRGIKLTLGWTLDDNLEYTTRLILFLINILPMAVALWVLTQIFRRYCRSHFGEVVLIVTACFGTLLIPFLTVFNNHTVGATAVIFALALALDITVEKKLQIWRFAVCGFFAGFACTQEFPAAALGAVLFGLLGRESWKKTLAAFGPLSLVPMIAHFVTTYLASGSLKPFYADYGTEKYRFVYEGVPSYWMDPKGIDQNLDSPTTYIFHCLVGHHGIFSLTPILLLTLVAWATAYGWSDRRLKIWNAVSLGLSLLVFGFYMTKTENYNYGGVTVALRWMLWLVPLWLVSMIPVVNAFGHSRIFKVLCLPLLGLSIFSAWYPPESPWTQPWLFQLLAEKKIIDYSDPRPLMTGNKTTWLRALATGDRRDNYWVEWRSYDGAGYPASLKLIDAGPVTQNGIDCREVIVEQTAYGQTARSQTLRISVDAHKKGLKPSEFLVWEESTPAADRSYWAQFLSGVPGEIEYRPSRIRYLRTRVRTDAFECLIASTAVSRELESRSMIVAREAWFSREIPFGIVQWEDRVIDGTTRVEYSKTNWTLWLSGVTYKRPERK